MITRNNYIKNITDPKTQQNALNLLISDANAPVINEFYSQPTADVRTEPPAIVPPMTNQYWTGFGQMLPPIPEDEETSDEDY